MDEYLGLILFQYLRKVWMQFVIVFVFEFRVVTQVKCDSYRIDLLFLSMSIDKIVDERVEDSRFIKGWLE